MPADPHPPEKADRRGAAAWCFYDWANSPYPAIVLTFVIPAYFANGVVQDPALATQWWAIMTGTAAFVIALASPILGSIADQGRRRKPWLAVFTLIMAAGSACLWFVRPELSDAMLLLVLVGVSVVAFELSMVFYNALLPNLVPIRWLGRVSGWAWGLGYIGGVGGLLFVLFCLDVASGNVAGVRLSGPVVAVWLLVFCLPLFVWTRDPRGRGLAAGPAIRAGMRELRTTLGNLTRYPQLWRYLLARMIFADGINTLFAFGGVYAAGTFGMSVPEVIVFGLVLNVTAGAGAFAFGWIDDWIGARRTILIGLTGLVVVGVPLLLVESKLAFIILGAGLGIFFGPVQAASRSLMARIIPPGTEGEMFGLYALSGKITAFAGPWIVALVTAVTGSQRWGMASVLPFLIVGGLMLLLMVREPDGEG
ncbi:MAG: MFS transporter [Alphaproteobacteria bacterium]|mgnify:CR=1 FL=1|nr:MFS transporter [Alphaproteobacteria bacterium]